MAGELSGSGNSGDRLLEIKQLDMAYDRFPSALKSSLLVSVLLVVALWSLVAHGILLVWLAVLWAVMLVRNLFVRRYSRIADKAGISIVRWKAGLVIGAA